MNGRIFLHNRQKVSARFGPVENFIINAILDSRKQVKTIISTYTAIMDLSSSLSLTTYLMVNKIQYRI